MLPKQPEQKSPTDVLAEAFKEIIIINVTTYLPTVLLRTSVHSLTVILHQDVPVLGSNHFKWLE